MLFCRSPSAPSRETTTSPYRCHEFSRALYCFVLAGLRAVGCALLISFQCPTTALGEQIAAIFQQWRFLHFSVSELSNPDINGPSADPDGDHLSNLQEYALGGDPFDAQPGRLAGGLIGE